MQNEFNWETAEAKSVAKNKGDIFLFGMNEEVHTFRLVSNPVSIEIHWEKDRARKNKRIICPATGCQICKSGHGAKTMYRCYVIERGQEDPVIQILEMTTNLFNKIITIAKKMGNPINYDMKIKRHIVNQSYTEYLACPAKNSQSLTDKEKKVAEIAKTKANDMSKPNTPEEILAMDLLCLPLSVDEQFDDFQVMANKGIEDDDWNNFN